MILTTLATILAAMAAFFSARAAHLQVHATRQQALLEARMTTREKFEEGYNKYLARDTIHAGEHPTANQLLLQAIRLGEFCFSEAIVQSMRRARELMCRDAFNYINDHPDKDFSLLEQVNGLCAQLLDNMKEEAYKHLKT